MKTPWLAGALLAVAIISHAPFAGAGEPPPPAVPEEPDREIAAEVEESSAALEEARTKLDRFLAEIQSVAPATADAPETPGEAPPPAASAPAPTLEDAFERFERTGFAPLVATPAATVYPYGRSQAIVTCLPTRVCDLRLEPGETIDGLALGDPTSWQLTELYEGETVLTPHVLLKPSRWDLATNLVVATNRRVYHVELRAPTERSARADEPTYDRAVSWWYPEQWAQRRRTVQERERAAAAARKAAVAQPAAVLDPLTLNWHYEIERPRRRRHRLPWTPSVVLDDGVRTLVRLPASVREAPAAFGLLDDGTYRPLNTSPIRDGWLVIPTVIDEIHLVVGAGDDRRFVRLVNRAHPSGA